MIPAQYRTKIFWVVALLLLIGSGLVHWKWGTNGIGVLGSYASVVGLIVTFYVAESVRSVRDRYAARFTWLQNFERFRALVDEFTDAGKAIDLQGIAGALMPLVIELGVHFHQDASVESLKKQLTDLIRSDARGVLAMKPGVIAQLRALQSQLEIQQGKDEARRDNA